MVEPTVVIAPPAQGVTIPLPACHGGNWVIETTTNLTEGWVGNVHVDYAVWQNFDRWYYSATNVVNGQTNYEATAMDGLSELGPVRFFRVVGE